MAKLFIFIVLLLFTPITVNADVIPPEYFEKKCELNEIEVECNYSSEKPFGPRTQDECSKYANDTNYRYLTGRGSSFGGSEKYCIGKGSYAVTQTPTNNILPTRIITTSSGNNPTQIPMFISTINPITNSLIYLFVTLLFEIPVFLILGFKKIKELVVILLANITSVLAFILSGFYLTFNPLFIIIAEILIIIFEMLVIKYLAGSPFRKTIIATLTANIFSALFGTILLVWINYLLAQ